MRWTLAWFLATTLTAIATTAHAQTCEPREASESPSFVAGRVVVEVLSGTGMATLGFVVGPELTGAACRRCLYAAGLAGANAAFPIGVAWGGSLVRGQGSFLATAAAPWLVSVTTVFALARDEDHDGRPAFQIGAIGGAAAAAISVTLYELTSARTRASTRPVVTATPRGDGMTVDVAGRF